MEAKFKKMLVVDLKQELTKLGLPTTGLKADLVARLVKHHESESNAPTKRKAEEITLEPNELKKSKSDNKPLLQRSGSSVYETDASYNRVREGPPDACLRRIVEDDKTLTLSRKNLEVSNSNNYYNYNFEYAVGNVTVTSGKWYYEAKILVSGQIMLGWCTNTYHPQTETGSYWGYDCNRQQKMQTGNGADQERYGEYCANGDVIGVFLDIETKTIQYSKNGKDLGICYSNVVPDSGGKLTPIIGVSRRGSVLVNFGKEKFEYACDGYNMLHCFLTEKEIAKLAKLFNSYRDIPNDEEGDVMDIERIRGNGMVQLQKDLGVEDDEDPLMLIISWKLNCKTVWEISRDEFMNGFTIHGCVTIDQIKQKSKEWHQEIRNNDVQFKKFYNFAFDYLKEDKTILGIDESLLLWKIVLKDKPWAMYQDWIDFLKKENKKSISRDVWQQLWHFMTTYPKDLKEYDDTSSWPIVYDDFVEWMKKK
eukprot:TRINITY_DN3344_c0_g1_i1.p1 TRINITY_DN3344_c0_g1~~TRINITY_DN3344_c0_g1_i1.p1  ORF type:complete len:478 (+),score=122.35 TRINITY_DN3344_c0_g1_i1:159-1592(+)